MSPQPWYSLWQRAAPTTAGCPPAAHCVTVGGGCVVWRGDPRITVMGLQKQNSLSSFIRKPFKKKKSKSKLSAAADDPGPVTVNQNGAVTGAGCERGSPLEDRVSQLTAELRELRAEMAALKGGVAALQTQVASRGRHRRDSYDSCWDAASLRFYAAREVPSVSWETPPPSVRLLRLNRSLDRIISSRADASNPVPYLVVASPWSVYKK